MNLTTENEKLCHEIAQDIAKLGLSNIHYECYGCNFNEGFAPAVYADDTLIIGMCDKGDDTLDDIPEEIRKKYDIVKEGEYGEFLNSEDEEVTLAHVYYMDPEEGGDSDYVSDYLSYEEADEMIGALTECLDTELSEVQYANETVNEFKEELEGFIGKISDCVEALKSLGDLEAVKRFNKIKRLINVEVN